MFKNTVCGKSRFDVIAELKGRRMFLKASLVSRILLLGLLFSFCCFCTIAAGQTSYIIVHALNPEGIDIASIQGMGQYSVEIYDSDNLIGYGAYNAESHNRPIPIPAGTHTIKVEFNGCQSNPERNAADDKRDDLHPHLRDRIHP
jgi:hypothetical protein